MSSVIKSCIKDLEKNKNPEKMLPEYVSRYMELNDSYFRINMMLEYDMFYEIVYEGLNPYIDSAKDIAEKLHKTVEVFFERKPSPQQAEELAKDLLVLRQEVVDRMQVVTAYVDCFVVYEYIMNRIQYRFEDMEKMPEDGDFAENLVNSIFSSKDSATVSENIRFAIGQLPMRMTRSRYFDLIRENISYYKGNDKSLLDGFLYIFRTNATLYRNENMDRYFTEFALVLKELSELDYEKIDKQTYEIYAEKIRINASKLHDVSDLYMQLGKLINDMYGICATAKYRSATEKPDAEEIVIRGINALFLNCDSDIWQYSGDTSVETEEEKFNWLNERFIDIEGKQERIYDTMNMAGASLEEIMESHRETIASAGLAEDFKVLHNLFYMSSGSVFADLEEQSTEEKVTEKMAEEASNTLIQECKELFQGKSRIFRRAIMANTLEHLPVFFTSAQEVADYVIQSLAQCQDEAEKYAAKQLLMEIMINPLT